MRKCSLLLALLMILSMVFSVGAYADETSSNYAVPFEINEDGAYYMVEQKTGTLIFAQNEHEKMLAKEVSENDS